MCTIVLKETLAYYTVDGGSAFCTLLDATKPFDRVNYCKLFTKLMSRNIPPKYLRLLLNMYTSSVARVSWNGIFSQSFTEENGVRQGGVVSHVLSCLYIDGMLQRLRDSGVGCFIGSVYVGALAYADDVALLAPTPRLRRLLQICENYGEEFTVAFNSSKSVWMYITRRAQPINGDIHFYVDGKQISRVTQCTHLGHVISTNMNDGHDILSRRNSVSGKLNNLLCQFWKCDPFVKLKLLRNFCTDFYGSCLWDLSHSSIEDLNIAWRKGLRRLLGLPYRTHTVLCYRPCVVRCHLSMN